MRNGKINRIILLDMRDEPGVVRSIGEFGVVRYLLNGVLHRRNGPAIIIPNGGKQWWQYGKLHRLDGPAVISADGYTAWYRDGYCHRDGGLPAVTFPHGAQLWFENGRNVR